MSKIGLDAAKNLFRMLVEVDDFNNVLRTAQVVAFSANRCVCEMTVEKQHTNSKGALHGGLSATLFDTVSSVAIMASEQATVGVTTDMSLSYLRPAMVGDRIRVEAECLKAGRTLAFSEGTIRRCSDNALLVTGKQTQFLPVDQQ